MFLGGLSTTTERKARKEGGSSGQVIALLTLCAVIIYRLCFFRKEKARPHLELQMLALQCLKDHSDDFPKEPVRSFMVLLILTSPVK